MLIEGGGPGVLRGDEGKSLGVCAGCDEGVAPATASELSTESSSVDMVSKGVTVGRAHRGGMCVENTAFAMCTRICPSKW